MKHQDNVVVAILVILIVLCLLYWIGSSQAPGNNIQQGAARRELIASGSAIGFYRSANTTSNALNAASSTKDLVVVQPSNTVYVPSTAGGFVPIGESAQQGAVPLPYNPNEIQISSEAQQQALTMGTSGRESNQIQRPRTQYETGTARTTLPTDSTIVPNGPVLNSKSFFHFFVMGGAAQTLNQYPNWYVLNASYPVTSPLQPVLFSPVSTRNYSPNNLFLTSVYSSINTQSSQNQQVVSLDYFWESGLLPTQQNLNVLNSTAQAQEVILGLPTTEWYKSAFVASNYANAKTISSPIVLWNYNGQQFPVLQLNSDLTQFNLATDNTIATTSPPISIPNQQNNGQPLYEIWVYSLLNTSASSSSTLSTSSPNVGVAFVSVPMADNGTSTNPYGSVAPGYLQMRVVNLCNNNALVTASVAQIESINNTGNLTVTSTSTIANNVPFGSSTGYTTVKAGGSNLITGYWTGVDVTFTITLNGATVYTTTIPIRSDFISDKMIYNQIVFAAGFNQNNYAVEAFVTNSAIQLLDL